MIMSQNYYYLVAGLPDIALDEAKGTVTLRDVMIELQEQLDETDRQLLKLLRYPFDNSNLIATLENREQEFDSRGNFTKEELSEMVKNPDVLPQYMQTFLDTYHDGRVPFPGLVLLDQLTWLFYDEISEHRSLFIREWFTFDRDLRNVIAGINCRKSLEHLEQRATERERAVASVVIGRNDVAEAVLRSSAPDFGLGTMVPWAESLLSSSKGSLIDFEKTVDLLRWNTCSDLTLFSYFSVDTILAFVIKLTIVERWRHLDPQVGRERLETLVEELQSGFSVPQGF
jgi:hypothetical protein